MQVVHVVASIAEEAAGPTYSVRRLCETLAQSGHEIDLMTLGQTAKGTNGHLHIQTFPRDFAALPGLRRLHASQAMRSALLDRALSADVLHNHGLWLMPNAYAALAARRGHMPLVVSPRGMLSPEALAFSAVRKRLFWHAWQRKALQTAGCLHATSEHERLNIRNSGIRAPVCVIPNGIDIPAARGVDSPARSLLFLGRLHPVKRVETLLRCWHRLGREFPDWDLVVAGPGDPSYVKSLTALSQQLALARVRFIGPLYGAEKLAAYRRASLYVLPSASENFGITIAESLAAGTPVVTTRGTPWEDLDRRGAGWWIDHGVEPLQSALATAMSLDAPALQNMGERGRQWMDQSFSWASVAGRMAAVYHWLVHGGPPPDDVEP